MSKNSETGTNLVERKYRRVIAFGLATGIGVSAIAGCGGNNDSTETPPPTETTLTEPIDSPLETDPSQTETPSAPETPSEVETNEFSAEIIRDLSPEELTERFQIKAEDISNPNEFVTTFVDRLEGLYNAGGTSEDWKPYENTGRGTFRDAMIEKYHEPIYLGLFGRADQSNTSEVTLDRYNNMISVDRPYFLTIELVEGSVHINEDSNGFDVTFDVHWHDNFDVKDLIGDIEGTDPQDFTARMTIENVRPNPNGVLYGDNYNSEKL